jgi:predicted peroxiredoxin/TusA-related sulfurtransferase
VASAPVEWNAGELGCGELVLELRNRLTAMKPGELFRLVALDPGAPADIPAWCRMTGHTLVSTQHPVYLIQRKEDRIMANKFCVSITHAKDNTDKATVGFVVANAAAGSGKETLVFLSVEAVRLAQKGYANDMHEEGFAPLRELMENFAKAGGTIYVCSPCFKKRKLDENNLVAGASIVGGAKLVEFLSDGSPCVSY